MEKTYRILIVDDKLDVLDKIKDLIKPTFKLLDDVWKIEIFTLHVEVIVDSAGNYSIKKEVFTKLGEISKKPFDLLFLDFGYRKSGDVSNLLETIKQQFGESFSFADLEKYVLNPRNLVEDGLKVLNQKHNKNYFSSFNNNFVNHKKNIYIYTYIPSEWRRYVQNTTIRENITKRTFPKAKNIELIDTRKEIFNDTEFDNIFKNNKRYYSFIISKFLEQIIHLEISKESILKSRFIKVKRTSRVIGLLVLFGAFIGATSEFFGDLIVEFFKADQILVGVVLIIFTLILILLGGRLLVYLLEKGLKNLLSDE